MSDLISREEALNCFPLLMQGELCTVGTIRNQLKKLPPVEPQEWTSVKKQGNPKLKDDKNYDTFLTTSKWVGESGDENIRVDINVWNREGTWSYHSWGGDEVIAWMPLPSPYNGE